MAEAGRTLQPPPLLPGLCDPGIRRVRRTDMENGTNTGTGTGTVRLQLKLSEPDELFSPEFNYGELIQSLQTKKEVPSAVPPHDPTNPFDDDARERREVEALAKKFESKYGTACSKKRKDRVQDLIDIGFGYDENDSFIDNSEAYDELVPASLTTKLGGFYINTGTLQFRATSESEGQEPDGDEQTREGEEPGLKRKRKDEDTEEKKLQKPQPPKQGLEPLNVPQPEKKKRKKLMKDSLCLAAMLRRFTKEKEEIRKQTPAGINPALTSNLHHAHTLRTTTNNDPLLTDLTSDPAVMSLLTSSNGNELHDLLSDLDFSVLDTGPQSAASGGENGKPAEGVVPKVAGGAQFRAAALLSPPPLPEGLPGPLIKRIEDLRTASRQFDQEGRKKFFTLDMNNILLDIELQVQEQPPMVRSCVYSHLEAFVPCNKETLLKRLKKLSLNIQDDRLRTPLLKLKLAVCSVMPEQTARYNMDCLARVAKQQMEDGERNVSEEEEEEKPGKRVMGPRKKFIWDDKLRALLCNLVRVKLKCYEQEKCSLSVEDYLKVFMENEVKPLWPKGWMQARMLFKESPASPFLTAYYPDCVGMSPSSSHGDLRPEQRRNIQPQIPGLCPYFQPFYQPNECGKALCVRPDMMELDELYEFPEFSRDPTMYLALRNLILAAWHRDCKEALTPQKCAPHVIVRGLVRIRCVQELDRVLHFMTRKGLINTGALLAKQPLLPEPYRNKKVLVVGAGPSGLAAARQLQNFGMQVVVLESRDRIGGRVWDDKSLGVTVGRGAQIVNGCVNNPIALMCEQLGVKMHKLRDRCDLIQEGGHITDPAIDKRMDFHFNAILDVVSDWRKDKSQHMDAPLGEKIQEVCKTFLQESTIQFSELEEKVLQFHLSNLEYACASTLDQVSAQSWDHNEFFAQFSGDHTLLTEGYSTLLHKLAQGLDIHLNSPVQSIDYSGNLVVVTTSGGTKFTAQKVLVTAPLALLQKNIIQFNPSLPERKLKAIHSLGAGIIEKIALQFPYRFWDSKVKGADYFGHVPPSPEKRGLFSVFYDMTPKGGQCVLMSVITGEAVALVKDLEEKAVVQLCMNVLRELFKEQEVPDPLKFFMTHWSKDVWSQMSYSFVKTGGSGEAYDIIAEDVQGKVFFAGEATNRHFPQTVTGAYLSGVREASKIAAL